MHARFPARFASLDHARAYLRRFFAWYNHEHRHTGLNLHTPADVHYGRTTTVTAARQLVLDVAHAAHPERFVRQAPVAALPPAAAWINPPIFVRYRHTEARCHALRCLGHSLRGPAGGAVGALHGVR